MKTKPRFSVWLFMVACWAVLTVADVEAQSSPDIVWQTNSHDVVRGLAFSADGRCLVSGGEDQTAIVWAVSNGTVTASVITPAQVLAVALSSNASMIVTGGDDGSFRLWNAATGAFLCGGRPGFRIAWSVDVNPVLSRFAFGESHGFIGVAAMECVPGGDSFEGHAGDILGVAFSPDGSRLASASSGGSAVVWRVSDGALLDNLTGHSLLDTNEDDQIYRAVHSVDFSPDGMLLATSGADGTAQLWRVSDGTRVRVLEGVGGFYNSAVRFTADGKAVFTVGDGTIKFWRVADGRLLTTFANLSAQRLDVCSDHKHFAYGAGGTVVLARVPLWMEKIEQIGNQLILGWQGGSGLYQLQSTTNVVNGPWQNVGTPTTATAFTNAVAGTNFYRVQSLPNP